MGSRDGDPSSGRVTDMAGKGQGRLIAILLVAAQALLPSPAVFAAEPVYFDDSRPDVMIVGSPSYYEVGLRKSNGSIAYIKDRKAGGTVSLGSEAESLWKVEVLGGSIPEAWASEYGGGGPAGDFRYTWSAARGELTMSYTARPGVPHGVSAEVVLRASAEAYFDLRMTVRNGGSGMVTGVSFPHQLAFLESEIEEALIPGPPGLILRSGWFKAHRSWGAGAGAPFTDYLGVRTTGGGSLALYSLRTPRDFWPVKLGIAHRIEESGRHTAQLQHTFPVVVPRGDAWITPTVRVRVSQSFLETVLAARRDSDLDALPSVRQKLGDRFDAVSRAPLFHLQSDFVDRRFGEWPQLLAEIPAPALLMIAFYWPAGIHGHHPDVLPPDPAQGTLDELRAAVGAAKARGFLVMPMILPSWWHEDSPTMKSLPPPLTARDIAVIDERGEPARSPWVIGGKEDWGYNVSPYHPYVRQRLDRLFAQLEDVFQPDMVYEDVVGAERLGPDLNPSAPRAGFSAGWYDHVRERRDLRMVNEWGSDMLAESAAGFLGSMQVSWENMDRDYGAGNWRVYPVAPLLVGDKVLFYQYWASAAVGKAYLGWDLALGSMLNYALMAKHKIGPCGNEPGGWGCAPLEPMDGPWPNAIFEFQSRVASRYAGTKMTAYEDLADGVTRSVFERVSVIRNWSTQRAYTAGGHTLPPEGVLVTSASGDLTAGILTGFNGVPLSAGDHYLIAERTADAIEIRQPIGPDTDLVLRPLSDWRDLAAIRVTGYDAGGAAIAEAPATATEAGIAFAYRARLGGKDVAYYRAEPGSRAPAPAAPSVTAERPATPADAGAGDPISAALGVASLAALLLGMAILVAYRRSRRSG